MYALSVHQPWAWAILNAGKNVENRKWRTNYRGPLLIHAAKSQTTYNAQDLERWKKWFGVCLPPWSELVTGAIVGVVEVVDCVRPVWTVPERVEVPGLGESKWALPEYWSWVLANPRPFDVAIAARGGQRLFKVNDNLISSQM